MRCSAALGVLALAACAGSDPVGPRAIHPSLGMYCDDPSVSGCWSDSDPAPPSSPGLALDAIHTVEVTTSGAVLYEFGKEIASASLAPSPDGGFDLTVLTSGLVRSVHLSAAEAGVYGNVDQFEPDCSNQEWAVGLLLLTMAGHALVDNVVGFVVTSVAFGRALYSFAKCKEEQSKPRGS